MTQESEVQTDPEFAIRLQAAMKEAGVSTQTLADFHGIAYESVRKWKTGKTRPNTERMETTARYLGVSALWLAWGQSGLPGEANNKQPALLGTKITHCEDLEFLRSTLETLWDILDDIDTASDMAKGNNELYRLRVEALQAKRWKLGIVTDGQTLYRKTP